MAWYWFALAGFLLIVLFALHFSKTLKEYERRLLETLAEKTTSLLFSISLYATLGIILFFAGYVMNMVVREANGGRMPVVISPKDPEPFFVPIDSFERYFYMKDSYVDENHRPAKLEFLANRHSIDLRFLNGYRLPNFLKRALDPLTITEREEGLYTRHYVSIGDLLTDIAVYIWGLVMLQIFVAIFRSIMSSLRRNLGQ